MCTVSSIVILLNLKGHIMVFMCYDIKKVKSFADLTILPLVRSRGGKPFAYFYHYCFFVVVGLPPLDLTNGKMVQSGNDLTFLML